MAEDNIGTLGLDPKASVVEIFNQANDTKLKDTDASLRVQTAADDNVAATLFAREPWSVFDELPYRGRTDIRWKRLNLGLFFGFDLDIPLQLPTDTVQLLAELQRRTGLRIDQSDVVLENIDWPAARRYKLKARPDSMRWYGEVEIVVMRLINLVKILPPPVGLESLGEELDPDHWVLEYGGDLNGNRFAHVWSTTPVPRVVDDSFDNQRLVVAFQNVLIQHRSLTRWVLQEAVVANNLYGAVVIDAGPVPDHLPSQYHTGLTHCVRLLLSPFYCVSPSGILTIYYNPAHRPGKEP